MNPDKVSPSNTQLAIQNSTFSFLAVITQLLGTTVIFFLIARMANIGIDEFGKLTYAFALAQLVAFTAEYGLMPYFAKAIAEKKLNSRALQGSSYGLHLVLMLTGFGVFLTTVQFLHLDPQLETVCHWIGSSVFVASSMRFLYCYYQGNEQHHMEFVSTLIETSIQISIVVAAFILHFDLLTLAKMYFFGRLASWSLVYLGFCRFHSMLTPRFDPTHWRETLQLALPFSATMIAAFAITTVDTLMLRALTPNNADYEVGLYQAALKLVLIPTILATVATRVFLPQLARISTQDKSNVFGNLCHLNNILFILGILAALFIYSQAETLAVLAYGQEFKEVGAVIAPLALVLGLRFGSAFNLYLTLQNFVWLRVAFAAIALTTLIITNYLLIPIYGVMGCVYALIITHLVYWVPFIITLYRLEKAPLMGWRWGYSLAIALTYAVVLWLTQTQSIWMVCMISVPITVLAVLYVLPADIRSGLITHTRLLAQRGRP